MYFVLYFGSEFYFPSFFRIFTLMMLYKQDSIRVITQHRQRRKLKLLFYSLLMQQELRKWFYLLILSPADDAIKAIEGARRHKQDVGCVHLYRLSP